MIEFQSNRKKLILGIMLSVLILVLMGLFIFRKEVARILNGKKENSGVSLTQKEVAFVRFIDDKPHLIYRGGDLGEMANKYFVFSGNNIVFEREIKGENHIIYNGKEIGLGFRPMLSGDNLAFYRKINNDVHLINNNKDLGSVFVETYYSAKMVGNNIAYEKNVDGKIHVIYNNQDLGEGHGFVLSEDGNMIAFVQNTNAGDVVVYNGNTFKNAGLIYDVNDKYVWYSSPPIAPSFFSLDDSDPKKMIDLPGISRNGERMGDGIGLVCDNGNCAYQSLVGEKLHFIYNGKDFGIMSNTGNDFNIAKDNFFFVRANESNESIVVYNGKELGMGSGPVIGDAGFAYVKEVDGKKHIIYNDKDLGEGFNPMLSADGGTIVFVREIDGKNHLISGEKDLGEINGDGFMIKIAD